MTSRSTLAALGLVGLAACQPPSTSAPTSKPSTPAQQYKLLDLVGGWRWMLRTDEPGTSRVEDEVWRLRPDPTAPTRLVGRYLRSVEVRSTDRVPFKCNQRIWYRQRALFDVTVDLDNQGIVVHEKDYEAETSPCDHGFRHLADYRAEATGNRLLLRWAKGSQTLWQVDQELADLPATPWPETLDPVGPWRWQATSYDDDGNIRDEAEWWEITRRSDTKLDATYRRRVTVRQPDGKPIACANAPTWSFDDAYVLTGEKEEEHWHLYEVGVEPGDHPCTRATPKRTTDEATAEQIGDYLVLEWRGKRRQILYRPDER
ncbi:MAG: hypothetical protein HOV81_06320 [Kofleriaceae bacterium]|nr:hypothetical protein [Kofleriaceae bacterium]